MAARGKLHRRHGEGSCYRRKDGRGWTAQVTVHGQRLSRVFRTEREGLAWCREMATKRDEGKLSADAYRATVADLFARWLAAIEPALAPNTHASYTSLVRIHVLPALGAVKLSQLSTDMLDLWYATKARQLAPGTVRALHAVVHNCLERAADKWHLLPSNPSRGAILPAVPRQERRAWTAEEGRAFLAAVEGERLAALWALALYTGLREGELCGLRWSDLDLSAPDYGRVNVLRQVQRARGEGKQVRELKTVGSQRQVLIPPRVVAALRQWQERQRAELVPSVHVFTTAEGQILEPANIRKWFSRLRRRLHLPYIRFHDLRHTAASLLLRDGVPPKIVSSLLGHSTIQQTINTYQHLFPDSQEQAAGAMGRLLQE